MFYFITLQPKNNVFITNKHVLITIVLLQYSSKTDNKFQKYNIDWQ